METIVDCPQPLAYPVVWDGPGLDLLRPLRMHKGQCADQWPPPPTPVPLSLCLGCGHHHTQHDWGQQCVMDTPPLPVLCNGHTSSSSTYCVMDTPPLHMLCNGHTSPSSTCCVMDTPPLPISQALLWRRGARLTHLRLTMSCWSTCSSPLAARTRLPTMVCLGTQPYPGDQAAGAGEGPAPPSGLQKGPQWGAKSQGVPRTPPTPLMSLQGREQCARPRVQVERPQGRDPED